MTLRALRTSLDTLVLCLFAVTGVMADLADTVGAEGWVARLAVGLVAIQVAVLAVDLPLDAWLDLRHDRRWGLSTQTARGLLADEAKSLILTTVFGAVLLVPFYVLIHATPLWWLWGAVGAVAGSLLSSWLFPVVIAPVFNTFTPLPEGELARRLRVLAERAAVPVAGVLVADSSRRSRRHNAYVAGMGRTRRIVLYDTLLEHAPPLVEHVVAHELGHWRRRHLVQELPLHAAGAFVALVALRLLTDWDRPWRMAGADGIGDPAGLPVIILAAQAATTVTGLLWAWVSRAHERQADLDALDLLADPATMSTMHRRLSAENLADLDPGWWARARSSHPPPAERLALTREWAGRHGRSPERPGAPMGGFQRPTT